MKLKLLAATVGVAVVGTFTLFAQETKSQWDGVYTSAQASRGEELYQQKCANCHAPDLTGYMDDYNPAPELTGDPFVDNWDTFTLGDLFEKTQMTMPQDDPGILSVEEAAAVVAFMLKFGEYPAGAADLPADLEALRAYQFTKAKPGT